MNIEDSSDIFWYALTYIFGEPKQYKYRISHQVENGLEPLQNYLHGKDEIVHSQEPAHKVIVEADARPSLTNF